MRRMSWIAGALMAATLFVGCSQEAKEDMGQAADSTGKAVEKTAEDAQKATANAVMTGKVKSAISTANDVVIEDLNVDTYDGKIVLKGKAKDEKSKTTAEEIAKTQAGNDYSVDNQITVGASA